MQLVECALQSWKERRWVDVPALSLADEQHRQTKRSAMPDRSQPSRAAVTLPKADRATRTLRLGEPMPQRPPLGQPFNRVAFAAAHVVADPLADTIRGSTARIDWDATIAYRRHLWGLGLAVAEAMDTAQRGMGLDWPKALELIRRSTAPPRAKAGAASSQRRRHRPSRPGRGAQVDDVIAPMRSSSRRSKPPAGASS